MNPAIATRRRHKAAEARSNEACCPSEGEINVAEAERWISLFTGGVLVTCGLVRGSASGLVLAGIGAALAYRGYSGHCNMYDAIGYSTAEQTA